LLAEAPPDANLGMPEKRELIVQALNVWETVQPKITARLFERADELAASHRRIRQAVHLKVRNLTVEPKLPADLLGVLVLQPLV
jgi:hypothetical protein